MGFFKARCKLSLLNLDVLEFEIGSKQTADTILLAANEKLNISEENYDCFALYYLDAENQVQWVNPMDTVVNILAQRDSSGHILLFHGVRFFPLSCLSVVDPNTVIQFFFDTRLQFVKGYLSMEFDDFTTCSAILILHKCGIESLEYSEVSRVFDEELAFPKLLLRQFEANVDQIHDEVYDKCLSFKNATHAQLIATFLKHCQNSALFGSVFYKFTDSVNHDIVLAVNSRSVLQFDPKNIYQPKKVFNFALVDDITCSEASLVISVRGERDEPYAAAFLKKATFKFQSTQVCKKIWSAIVAQHKYYRSQIAETSHQGSEYSLQLLTDRLSQFFASSSTIASSGPSNSSLGSTRSYSTTSMKSRVSDVTVDQPLTSYQRTKEEKERDLQSYYKLKGEVKLIEDELLYKLEELKQLCVEEANITGDMPKEIFMTLLPGESMPNTTKRMGTAFKLDRDVIPTSNFTTEADQLQADIQLHRKIVAAAERLANDRTTNKLVRKKRKRDFKAAATKLRGLEKGLYQLRLSASKPDISEFDGLSQLPKSSVGSGFSLNSLKHWPNFMNPKIGFVAKSCPTTPRGSIQDMSQEDVEKLSVGKAFNMRGPAQRTANKISALNWAEKQRRSSGALPPSVPQRKHTTGSLGYCQSDSSSLACQSTSSIAFETPTYSNIGYESVVPYQSSYRRSNFPTLQERYGLASRSRSTSSYGEPIRRTEYHGQHQSTISEKRDTDSVIATGFSTSSLDRRMLRSRPTSTTSVNPQLRDSTSSGVSSASSFAGSPCTMSRTTTFPVSPEYGEPSSHTMTSSISSSRLQPQNIDHILSSISSRAAIHFKNSPALGSPSKKTATVV